MSKKVDKLIVEIEKIGTEKFVLSFDPNGVNNTIDGYQWELLVKAYCHDEKMSLEDVIHDPESDMYSAYAATKEPLEKISAALQILITNNNLCEKYIKSANQQDFSEDDDMSTEEFLEWMVEAGYNMNSPRIFIFDLDGIKDAIQADAIQNEIENKGYKTKVESYDDDVYFEIRAKIKPILNEVLKIESFLEAVARKYNVKYIGCGIN